MNIKKLRFRRQKNFADCALIAAINARIFLGMKNVPEAVYRWLVRETAGNTGSCIYIEKAYPILGLDYTDRKKLVLKESYLPIDISTLEYRRGFHSSLIVGFKGKRIRVINHYKDWFELDELMSIIPAEMDARRFRSFKRLVRKK